MNILPHKSWHVRTKKNIARVRKDEAEAAEAEKEVQRRIALAAQESRTDFLRERASQRCQNVALESLPSSLPVEQVADIIQKDGHVNFFQDIEDGIQQQGKTNKEHEEEKKKEQEDYEKQIGYLTFLGQNSVEQTKERPWYEKIDRFTKPESVTVTSTSLVVPSESNDKNKKGPDDATAALKQAKFKEFHDPLKDIRKYLATPGIKAKIDKTLAKSKTKTVTVSLKRAREVDEEALHSGPAFKKLKKSKKSKKSKHKKKDKLDKKRKHHHHHKSKQVKKQKHQEKKDHHRSRNNNKSKSSSHSGSSSKSSDSGSDSGSDWVTTDDESDREEKLKRAKLASLRAERLEREREEGRKVEKLMAKLRGEVVVEETKSSEFRVHSSGVKQKYNAQFNPHLARQNFEN